MSGCSVKNYPTRVQALDAITKSLVKALESALQKQNRITFGVCGGRSAEALFPLLAASALPWAS
ncbi:MAG: 6-phosphogluconolactonase, partial [Arenicellales bacterium]|nr:6-phosphogluconolactonase [Arenicellales bacterium]